MRCTSVLDGPALKPLPVARHELARWAPCTVDNDYHVEVDGSHYSVPYQLIGEDVEVRTTALMVEVMLKEKACELAPAKKKTRESSSRPPSTCLALTANTSSGRRRV